MSCNVNAKEIKYVSASTGLNLREKPNTKSEVIKVLPFGTKLDIKIDNVGKNKLWLKVKTEYGDGYVHSDYTQNEDPLEDMEYLGNWHITAYTHTGNPCANGNMPTAGHTIACNSLDFGTKVYIVGLGIRVVEDRGPDYLGSSWLDCFMDSYNSCIQFGSQYLDVYLITEDK